MDHDSWYIDIGGGKLWKTHTVQKLFQNEGIVTLGKLQNCILYGANLWDKNILEKMANTDIKWCFFNEHVFQCEFHNRICSNLELLSFTTDNSDEFESTYYFISGTGTGYQIDHIRVCHVDIIQF